MNIHAFQAIYPKLDFVASPESFFGTVKYQYKEYFQSGFFEKNSQEAIYIYEIRTIRRTHRGLITCTALKDYYNGLVVKHENTLAAKEQKMMHLILQREAMVKPVLLTYPSVKEIDHLIEDQIEKNQVFYSIPFVEDNQVHTFWQITDGNLIKKLKDLFKKKVKRSFIADGHHRYSATSILAKSAKSAQSSPKEFSFDSIISAYFSFDQLEIWDYNRVVQILHEKTATEIIAKISKYCKIKMLNHGRKPKRKHEMTLFINKEWYSIKWKKSILGKFDNKKIVLDTELMNRLIMEDIFGIEDVRSDIRVRYVSGIEGVEGIIHSVQSNELRIGFMLYPLNIEEITQVAMNGDTLPPKSSWFEPRIRNGLLSQEI